LINKVAILSVVIYLLHDDVTMNSVVICKCNDTVFITDVTSHRSNTQVIGGGVQSPGNWLQPQAALFL